MYEAQLRNISRVAQFPVAAWRNHFVLTSEMVQQLRSRNYLDRWQLSVQNEWYHIKLEDHSIFQFQEGGTTRSLNFLQCPLDVPSFRDFLIKEQGVLLDRTNRRMYQDIYDLALQTAAKREHITPIRYDRDPIAYRTGVHPLAHIHIGLDNEIRIALRREMLAAGFVLFVMRHHYPSCWEQLLEHHTNLKLANRIRLDCIEVAQQWWQPHDQLELALT